MFRKPGDSSSSSSDESYDDTQDDDTDALPQDSVLSRINTLDSAVSGGPAVRNVHPRLEVRQSSAQNVRDLLLHSLLEERTIRQVAEQLGKDVTDPEVQRLGREAYQEIARQISNNVDDTYASNEMQTHRATANDGINKLTRNNLSKLSVIPEGPNQALMARRPQGGLTVDLPQQPASAFDILSGLPAPTELYLRGYPGLQVDRYAREFSELDVVGKGGYGKVYKAKHKLDGSLYAVKRIPVSSAKVAKIQEQGPQELESMLEEVRSLARFDHNNIVRYHNAWLEYTTMPNEMSIGPPISMLRNDRLLENPAASPTNSDELGNINSKLDSLVFDDPLITTDPSYGAGIVFETSDPGNAAEESKSESDGMSLKEKLRFYKRKNRRGSQASQATIATISSSKSRMSAVEDVDEEEDEDVEMIPRSHMPYSQEPASDLSESMISHSDVPGQVITAPTSGPMLTLNVQMSLCETNLAAFLSSERSQVTEPLDRHCFHPCVSLELLNSIVSGVEYLHSRGVVHRDLKPANVFMSLSTDVYPPYGSVDISTCKTCSDRSCIHVTPRIGDFGLVAALDDKCIGADAGMKPVGTEFYRPHAYTGISEKLDVFALGVIAFEMLQMFGTRMERVAALTELRRGVFPHGFAEGLGDAGDKVQQLVGTMVQTDSSQGISCSEVKAEIARLVHDLKQ